MLRYEPDFVIMRHAGEMAERLYALVMKTSKVATPARVRSPVSPPFLYTLATFIHRAACLELFKPRPLSPRTRSNIPLGSFAHHATATVSRRAGRKLFIVDKERLALVLAKHYHTINHRSFRHITVHKFCSHRQCCCVNPLI